MKIACISTSSVPASTANSIQVMKVCQALVQLGHEVRLWIPGRVHTPWQNLSDYYGIDHPFEIDWLSAHLYLKRYDFAMAALLKAARWQADLIYTWTPQAALFGLLRRFPAVLEVHDRPKGKLGPSLMRWLVKIKGQKGFAVITQALVNALENEFKIIIQPKTLIIAPDGVDLERYQDLPSPETARQQLNLPQQLTCIYSGHLYPGRGMDLLFSLAKELPQVQFLWVGGQPQAVADWRQVIQQTGLENLTLTGFVENRALPIYQAAGEIQLMPYGLSVAGSSGGNTADICSPMKMFEYLASGRAIITSDLPVLREVLNEKNAVFCLPESIKDWVSAVNELLTSPQKMAALSAQARLDAEQYTWQKRQEKILAVINNQKKP